ncbi:MAG: aminotransferase class I/II-fold pyridoxal phosphate-dependent enzyme [Gemmatimonadetes bacterium]|nr:aminotransferase class I/II-fold pyridoxal phosphate-dependent enzyme [Gemmatimonadota bacterium]
MTGTAAPHTSPSALPTSSASRLSTLSDTLKPSLILTIAAETREVIASGQPVCNLTVGDFDPAHFPIPERLAQNLARLVQQGETNYPPSAGMPALRTAVAKFYKDWLGLDYTDSNVLVVSGGRPVIYGAYRAVVNPGDRVVYPTPSWSNEYYTPIVGAQAVEVPCTAETGFLPTAAQLAPSLRGASLLVLCSPMNPCGTLFDEQQLGEICDAVLAENARRGANERPLFLLYDQMYWMLTFGGGKHFTPVGVRPDMAKYTIFVDGISKSFAATGLRVGWAVGPADVIKTMSNLLTHVGAWAPRAEQIATADLLGATDEIKAFHRVMLPGLEGRLKFLADGIAALKADGHDVDSTPPRGSIYLSARFGLNGKTAPGGERLVTNDDIRRYLLRSCGLAAVQFQAFSARDETGWFRLSAGAVTPDDIRALMTRLRGALAAVK